ncbi:MAG: MATE family efflux transporter [Bacteroidales bacterium]|jgi:putative MATE family efflux protein|nr:MATE family efflux transporter [Bacteroidales bacterium]
MSITLKKHKDHNPQELEQKPVSTLLWMYSIPAIITAVANSLYNIIDRLFIGNSVGAMAISGLALSLPIMILLQAFGTLVGVGAASRISIVLGMKDKNWAEDILGTAILMTVIIWAVVSASFMFALDPILIFFGGSPETIPYAKEFLQIIIPFSLFSNFAYSYCNIIRASGYPEKSMVIMVLGLVVNILLDVLFILVFGWGIRGVAIATAMAMFFTAIATMYHFTRQKSFIRFHWNKLRIRLFIVRNITSIGLAPFLINVAASIVTVLYNTHLKRLGGDLAVGAYGIVNSLAVVFVMLVLGLCQGMQPVAGYNFGAGLMPRVKEVLRKSLFVATVITTTGFVAVELFPHAIARCFTSDKSLSEMTAAGLRYVFLIYPFVGYQIVTGNFFQAIGRASSSIFLSLIRQTLYLIPMLFLLPLFWGMDGLWVATPVSDFLAFITSFFMLRRWLRSTS